MDERLWSLPTSWILATVADSVLILRTPPSLRILAKAAYVPLGASHVSFSTSGHSCARFPGDADAGRPPSRSCWRL